MEQGRDLTPRGQHQELGNTIHGYGGGWTQGSGLSCTDSQSHCQVLPKREYGRGFTVPLLQGDSFGVVGEAW